MLITTPDLGEDKGKSGSVHIRTDVCSRSGKIEIYRLLTTAIGPRGKEAVFVSISQPLSDNATYTLEQRTREVQAPELWYPDRLVPYKAVNPPYHGGKLIDRYKTPSGSRWFEWTPSRGFFLSGEHYYSKGANVHQDHVGRGSAVTETGMRGDIRLVKEADFNLVRDSHYPHSLVFLQTRDEIGILFWAGNASRGTGGHKGDGHWNASVYPVNKTDKAGFEDSVKAQLKEPVRIHRSHPPIVIWNISNELFFTAPKMIDSIRELLSETVKFSK